MSTPHGSNLPKIKLQNETLIREAIYKYAPISRKEIANRLSLTPPTITTNVASLIKQGLVHECETNSDSIQGQSGRPPVYIDFISDARYSIGVDHSPFLTAICIADIRGNTIYERYEPVLSNDYAQALLDLKRYIQESIQDSKLNPARITGVGICMPGLIDEARGFVTYNPRSKWRDKPLADDLSAICHLPVHLQNNAQARAIAEDLFSLFNANKTFAYLFISKGISCPLIISNGLHTSTTFGAGEIGQCAFAQNTAWQNNFQENRLDSIASETAILKRCQQMMAENAGSLLHQICPTPATLTIEQVLQAQAENDLAVNQIMMDTIFYITQAISFIINFASPPLILVDSQIFTLAANQDAFFLYIKKFLFSANLDEIQFVFLPHDQLRGARAATALVIQNEILTAK